MSELSIFEKIFLALVLAKDAGVGCEFTNLEVIELLGHIRSMSETVGLDRQRIAELEAELAACESALCSMVRQYNRNSDDDPAVYSHDFMTAGEDAFDYLVGAGLAEYCSNGVFIRFVDKQEVEE